MGGVAVRRGPIGDIARTDTGTLVVTNYGDDTVTLLDADTLAVSGVVGVPGEPFAVAAADDRAFVSTSSAVFDAVSVIDTYTNTLVATYTLAFSVGALAASPDGKRVFAGRTGDGRVDVAVIDVTAERVGTIDVGTGPGIGIDAVQVDPTGKRLFVATTDARTSALVVIDVETARVAQRVAVDAPIRDIALGDRAVYILTSDRVRGGAVQIVDLSAGRVVDAIGLGVGAPTRLTMSDDKTRAYIVDYDNVTVLCTLTHKIVNAVQVTARPSCVAIDSDHSRLYVADCTGEVSAFSTASAMPLLYSQFMATDPMSVPDVPELEPVHA
jgi:YVTN family beta-propeller protein